ncbi:RHS repeat protein [Luteolibacter ambystomatis]|uniref:RHS repeat protein n=1 Tax=Luteolibacter ambystomatis TaxID=2824561 RepID=A0A975J343_9BACT|nr:RHS repeat protein [Luteolibacter ambystomatis]QUE53116.1 RHS repeat protein [Luteolibacter ambystomatis]
MKRFPVHPLLALLGMLTATLAPVLGADCNCAKPKVRLSANHILYTEDPVTHEKVDEVKLKFQGPGDATAAEIKSPTEKELKRDTVYALSIEVASPSSIMCDPNVHLNFPHCTIEYSMDEGATWLWGTTARIVVGEIPGGGGYTYTPSRVLIRVAGPKSDKAAGTSGTGSQATISASAAEFSPPEGPAGITQKAPGMGYEIPLGSALVGGGYRSAGYLAKYGTVSSSFASPAGIEVDALTEVTSGISPLVSQYSQLNGASEVEESHIIAPEGVFRVRGWDSGSSAATDLEGAAATLVEVYTPAQYNASSHAFSGTPHSYYRIEVATGNGLAAGVKMTESNHGVVHTSSFQASTDGLQLRTRKDAIVTETITVPPASSETSWQQHILEKRDGVTISDTTNTYELLAWGYEITESTVDPDSGESGDELTTYTTFYSDGRLQTVSNPDGSWVYHEYSTIDPTVKTTYSPWLSESTMTVTGGVVSMSGPVVATTSSGSVTDTRLTTVYAGGAGTPIAYETSSGSGYTSGGKSYYYSASGQVRSLDGSGGIPLALSNPGVIASYSITHGEDADPVWLSSRTAMSWDASGKGSLWEYEKGDWDSSSGFSADPDGAFLRTSVSSGYVGGDPSVPHGPSSFTHVPSHSTKQVTIDGPNGVVREEQQICNGSGVYEVALAKDYEYETAFPYRPTGCKTNGVYVSKTEYVSPLVIRQWNEEGAMTETETDASGEVIRTTTSGNSTVPAVTTTYRRSGATTTTFVNGARVSVETLDAAGRTILSQDATGAKVETSYADGGRTVTRKAPGNVSVTESLHYDGKLASKEGNGTVPEFHDYSVDATGRLTHTTILGTETGLRRVSVVTNLDGSTSEQISPDPAGGDPITVTYEYADGIPVWLRMTSTAANTPDQVRSSPLVSAEALMGHYSLSGVETDDNGPSVSSGDRLTETSSSFVKESGVWFLETVKKAFHTDDSTDAYVVTSRNAVTPSSVSSSHGSGLQWVSTKTDGTTTTTLHKDVYFDTATTVVSSDDSATSISPDQVSISQYGKTISNSVYGSANPETMAYDAAGRLIRQTSALGAITTNFYNSAGQLESTTDHENKTTRYAYYAPNVASAGQLKETTNAASETEQVSYNAMGLLTEVKGSGTNRITYTYNTLGERTGMRTYRTSSPSDPGDLTEWEYDAATGVLKSKTDAGSHEVAYVYDSAGRIQTRTWARGGDTGYSYNGFGDLTDIVYDDPMTPDVAISRDRLGRPAMITDGSGTRTSSYHSTTGGLDLLTYDSSSPLASLEIDYTWDSSLRGNGHAVSGGGPSVTRTFDTAGRTLAVTGGGSTHTSAYLPGTAILSTRATAYSSTTVLNRTDYHDRLGRVTGTQVTNGASATVSRHGYAYDAADRRTRNRRENNQFWDYSYDSRGQVTAATKKFPNSDAIPGHAYSYAYDSIGNRTSAVMGGGTAVAYEANALNQYAEIETPGTRWILGEAPVADAVTVNGATAARAGGLGFFSKQLTDTNTTPLWSNDTIVSNGVTVTGHTWTPAATFTPSYDADGNLTNDGRWNLTWDKENRLARMETTSAAATAGVPRTRLDFTYDSQGRRVAKSVESSTDGTTWTFVSSRRFLYDGWNLIAEYTAPSASSGTLTLDASYTWGDDLSSSPQGAGGVGGLLAVQLYGGTTATYYPAYSGSGDVNAWVDTSGSVVDRRDYSPFGQLVTHYKLTGGSTPADRLNFGFSTKYTDSETGLLYYGYRYYDARNGSWLSQDPSGELGGANLYNFSANRGINAIDVLGLYIHEAGVIGPAEAVRGISGAEKPAESDFIKAQAVLMTLPITPTDAQSVGLALRLMTRAGALHTVSKFYDHNVVDGTMTAGPGNRWVFTCKYGWIDMAHYYNTAKIAYVTNRAVSYVASLANEVAQLSVKLERLSGVPILWYGTFLNTSESAYTAEDLNSNYQGANYGGNKSWMDLAQTSTSTSLSSSGSTLGRDFRTFMRSAGAVETRRDPVVLTILKTDASGWHSGSFYNLPMTFTRGDSLRLQRGRISYLCLCDGLVPRSAKWTYK